jgi:hypothetical protein
MSLYKPEINYDTALYALQENVVLKQRLEEDKQQYIKRLEEEEKKLAKAVLHLNKVRWLESYNEEKLDKALDDVRCLKRSLDIRTKQRDRTRSWNRWFNFPMMAFLLVDFIISVWLFCMIGGK